MANKTVYQNDKADLDPAGRLYYLDWLRVLAIIFVLLIHSSKFFDYHTSVLFNEVRSPVLSTFREFVLLWIMPFFFCVSGAAVFLSFQFQNTGGFVKSKLMRILVPSVLVGSFIVNPPYVYMEKLFSGKTEYSFFKWFTHYFEGMHGMGGNFAPWGMGTHIWYLQFLFIFSLIFLPLFIRSKRSGKSLLERLAPAFKNPVALFLLCLPVVAIGFFFEYAGMSGARSMGTWDPISYMFFFLFGYIIYSNAQIQETIRKYSTVYLVLALALTVVHLASHFGILLKLQGITRHDIGTGEILPLDHSKFAIAQIFRGIAAWGWTLALLGLGRRYLNFNNKNRTYANEAVLPFYILHHTVIYIVGYYVIQWGLGVGTKFSVITIVSFVLIMAIYEILIRRINILRILFGLKSKKKAAMSISTQQPAKVS